MDEANAKAMKEWIETYFEMVEAKIKNLDKLIELGFIEESLTLSLCYIDAMANSPYPTGGNKRDKFIKIIYEYSDYKEYFSKISRIFLSSRGKDISEKEKDGIPIACHNEIKKTLLEKYGRDNDCRKEVAKDILIGFLKVKLNTVDWGNIEKNLDNFSYASVLWQMYRSSGVHEMALYTPLKKGEPFFERNERGEDIYYVDDILCFSKEIIISMLKNIHRNLRRKCLEELKWANELI